MLSESQAIERARAFVAASSLPHCGEIVRSYHMPADFFHRVGIKCRDGTYVIAFAYTGPPVPPELESICPSGPSDTSICVDDRTGKCRVLMKL